MVLYYKSDGDNMMVKLSGILCHNQNFGPNREIILMSDEESCNSFFTVPTTYQIIIIIYNYTCTCFSFYRPMSVRYLLFLLNLHSSWFIISYILVFSPLLFF